jgi:predicted metal-dependent enzyme (double-stranded beta helix superfamily)
MSYDLSAFTADCHAIFKRDPGPAGREQARLLLEKLLQDEAFVREHCRESKPGLHLLYEDPELKFQVLAHINENPRVSPPHDHGESWAIYGQAIEHTDMTEWARTDDGADPDRAKLEPVRKYRLTPGHAGIYQDGTIHSIDYPANSCFVRVTGTNLDQIPRVMFNLETGAVKQMTRQQAT